MTNKRLKELHEIFLNHPNIVRDNRQIQEGDIFWALKGERFDGNDFAQDAIDKGAHIAVIDNIKLKNKKFFLVDDSLRALQELGRFHREYIGMPVIGITGSNGKTTTKELINAVLSQLYNTSFTYKNLNNHIGVPLTLLDIPEDTDLAIVEMGSNHFGEIKTLVDLALPNFAVITSIGKAHLEFFIDLEGVTREKSELFNFVKNNKGLVFVNLDDEIISKISSGMNTFTFSYNKQKQADVHLQDISTSPELKIQLNQTQIQTKLSGKYNLSNLGYAIAVGKYFNLPDEMIKEALEHYTPKDMRSQIIEKNSNLIVLDAYNANPTSMKAAIDSLVNMEGDKKIAIVGDMFELGKNADKEHQYITDYLNKKGLKAYLIGENFAQTKSKFDTYKNTADFIKSDVFKQLKNATILIKGSRGMALESIVEE
jgi:UDP-N-acetylmuramoyl-tripeptide--D-alanyl-D-alanine ligase